jgi:hypothetical protein
MRNVGLVAGMCLVACVAGLGSAKTAFEYPSVVLDLYDADDSCWWDGMGAAGDYPIHVVPELWLVGAPPSDLSAVTFPEDHWIDLLFSGPLVPVDGNDIELIEWGRAGEQVLVFLTDGVDQEYLVNIAAASNAGGQYPTRIGLDLPDISLPFTPRALRLVAVDHGGSSPGFDLGSVRAWVSHDCADEASAPNPVSGQTDVRPDSKLDWRASCQAQEHIIYLSSDASQVSASAPEARRAVQPRDANVYDPQILQLGHTYYWRVNEVLEDGNVVPGPTWHFTVTNQILIDNFDQYRDTGPVLFDSWLRRDRAWTYLERDVTWHSCGQSMVFMYYFDGWDYSEVFHPFEAPQHWLGEGVRSLEFWIYGGANNATAGEMHVTLADADGEESVACVDVDPIALTRPEWTPCRADLTGFVQVDTNDVRGVGIGFHLPADVPELDYRGTIHVDDISVHPAECLEETRPSGDVNADCAVNSEDLDLIATQWLTGRTRTVEVEPPNDPILRYEFEGNVLDSVGISHGQIEGRPAYAPGKHGQAIQFMNKGDAVEIVRAPMLFKRTRQAITIAFWQYANDSSHLNDTVCCSDYSLGEYAPSISINLGCWKNPGQYRWDCGTPWSFANRLAGHHRTKLEWTGRWNHWVFTKDVLWEGSVPSEQQGQNVLVTGKMEIYLNGVLYDSRYGTVSPIDGITWFEIGSGWYGQYDGLIDDFEIYDYALPASQVAYLASEGTGILEATLPPEADLDHSDKVDFGDFAILASQWLSEGLWP